MSSPKRPRRSSRKTRKQRAKMKALSLVPTVAKAVTDEALPTVQPHCDDYVESPSGHPAARWFIFIHRLPAGLRLLAEEHGVRPRLFADYNGERIRVTVASRLGDLGISRDLTRENGCDERGITVDKLTNFSESP